MPIKIALAQIDIAIADRARNLARMIEVLSAAAAEEAKLVVFPEGVTRIPRMLSRCGLRLYARC